MKNNMFYYDEENDLMEYMDAGAETPVHSWVNNYLSLMFPIDCKDFVPKNIIGFQINGMKYMIKKAQEQMEEALTPEEIEKLSELLKKCGCIVSVNADGKRICNWETVRKENGFTKDTSASIKQTMDTNKGNPID